MNLINECRLCDTANHSQLSFIRQCYCCFQEAEFSLYAEATLFGHAIVIDKEDTGDNFLLSTLLISGREEMLYFNYCNQRRL